MKELNITDICCPICQAQMIWSDGDRFFCGGGGEREHTPLFIVIEFEDDLDG